MLYPLLAPNRRRERRRDILAALVDSCGYRLDRVVDLTQLEARGEYLEGTGSVVLDRARRVAYACRSPRTQRAGARGVRARAPLRDRSVQRRRRRRPADLSHERHALARHALRRTVHGRDRRRHGAPQRRCAPGGVGARGHRPVDGRSSSASPAMCSSSRARAGPSLRYRPRLCARWRRRTRHALERHGRLVSADIATIERIGGGSVRCMLAEVALPSSAGGRGAGVAGWNPGGTVSPRPTDGRRRPRSPGSSARPCVRASHRGSCGRSP